MHPAGPPGGDGISRSRCAWFGRFRRSGVESLLVHQKRNTAPTRSPAASRYASFQKRPSAVSRRTIPNTPQSMRPMASTLWIGWTSKLPEQDKTQEPNGHQDDHGALPRCPRRARSAWSGAAMCGAAVGLVPMLDCSWCLRPGRGHGRCPVDAKVSDAHRRFGAGIAPGFGFPSGSARTNVSRRQLPESPRVPGPRGCPGRGRPGRWPLLGCRAGGPCRCILRVLPARPACGGRTVCMKASTSSRWLFPWSAA